MKKRLKCPWKQVLESHLRKEDGKTFTGDNQRGERVRICGENEWREIV